MLEGRLNEFRLGDVFQLLAWTRKSGALSVEAGKRRGRVDFSCGQIAFAIADVRRAELGARLANAGIVDEDGLRRVVEAQHSGPGRVAEVLLDEGLDEHVADETLREHIQDAVFTLMRTADGGFTFEPGDDHDELPGPRLETEGLIAEGARRLEEWEEVRQRIPSSDAVLAMTPNPPAGSDSVTVSADQWRLLVLVDGARSVAELVELTGQGEFATSQVLAELVEAGLLDAVDPADGDTGLGQLLARRESLRELEASELGIPSEAARPEPEDALPEPEDALPELENALPELEDALPEPEDALPELEDALPEPGEAQDADPEPGNSFGSEPQPESAPLSEDEQEAAPGPEFGAELEIGSEDAPELAFPGEPETSPAPEPALESEPAPEAAPVFEGEPVPVPVPVPDPAWSLEPVPDTVSAWAHAPAAPNESALDAPADGFLDGDLTSEGAHGEPAGETASPEDATAPAGEPQDLHEVPLGSGTDSGPRPGVDRVQVARELASLGFEGPPATPAPTTDEPPRRLTRDEDVTRGLLVRLMDGVRKA